MCLRDAPQPVRSVFTQLLDAHGGLLAPEEIATGIDRSLIEVRDALGLLVRAGLAHQADGLYLASRASLEAASLLT
jgi:hypothetical protein